MAENLRPSYNKKTFFAMKTECAVSKSPLTALKPAPARRWLFPCPKLNQNDF